MTSDREPNIPGYRGGLVKLMGGSVDLALLVTLAFLESMPMGLLFSLYAPYLKELGFTATEYGVLSGISLLLSIASSLAGGILVDRIGAKNTMILGVLIGVPGLLLISMGSKSFVYIGVILWGSSGGLASVSSLVLATRIPSGVLERNLSYISAASTIGGGLGAFGGWIPYLLKAYGLSLLDSYRLLIALIALYSIIPVLLIVPRVREVIDDRVGGDDDRVGGSDSVNWGVLVRLIVVNVIISVGAGTSIHIIDYYFVLKFGVKSGELGTVWGVQNLIMGLLMILMPRLSSKLGGALRTYVVVASPSIILLAALVFTKSFTIAAAVYVIRSTLMNVANPLYQAFEMSLIPSRFRGRGASILSLAWQIPASLGRSIGGFLMDLNIEAPIVATTILYSTAFILLAIFFPQYILPRRHGGTVRPQNNI